MDINFWLDIGEKFATILTALFAAGWSIYFWCDHIRKRRRLENYLENEAKTLHTIYNIMSKKGMTEDEISSIPSFM